jgi:hypothetical protein
MKNPTKMHQFCAKPLAEPGQRRGSLPCNDGFAFERRFSEGNRGTELFVLSHENIPLNDFRSCFQNFRNDPQPSVAREIVLDWVWRMTCLSWGEAE